MPGPAGFPQLRETIAILTSFRRKPAARGTERPSRGAVGNATITRPLCPSDISPVQRGKPGSSGACRRRFRSPKSSSGVAKLLIEPSPTPYNTSHPTNPHQHHTLRVPQAAGFRRNDEHYAKMSPFAQRKGTRSEANAGVCPGRPGFPRSAGEMSEGQRGAQNNHGHDPADGQTERNRRHPRLHLEP